MGEQKNTIVINGKIYDAISGALIKGSSASGDSLVSGFIGLETSSASHATHKTVHPPHHLAHHKPQKSTTLKRSLKIRHASVANARSLPIETSATITAQGQKNLSTNIDRYERAKKVSKSSVVSRFNIGSQQIEPTLTKKHQHLPVKPAPHEVTSHHQTASTASYPANQTSEEIFSAALSDADSHKQTPLKLGHRKHRISKKLGLSARTGNVMAIVLIVVVLGGFIAYQNIPNVAMRMAISQSGVSGAALPGFKPSGFSLNQHMTASPGQITLSFHSNSDSRAFTITQASSNWNSQTLADSFLNSQQVQRANQPDGKTVYLYGNSNATWVDGGIWYRIEGNSSLTSAQLLKIASSF